MSRLQVLLPGESPAPGTGSGKTGTPTNQTAGVPFTITVRGCDNQWNLVTSASDAIQILSSDASATLPQPAQLANGTASFTVTLNAAGSFTIYAHDLTDATIPDGASSLVRTLVLQGFVFQKITQKNQYAGTPMGTTVTAVDPNGNTVSGYSGAVSLKEITSYGDGRITPDTITLSGGTWSGNVTMYRADETSINRGNVNLYAWIANAPAKNGTSDPFTVHPGSFARLQVVMPGQTPLPGSVSGLVGTPATQSAGHAFTVGVYGTDNYWNPVPSFDNVRLVSSDPLANLPQTGALSNGYKSFSVSFGTVGTQTLTASDQTNSGITPMTSTPVNVLPSAADHFVIGTISSPQTAGVAVAVSIRATDSQGNTVPGYTGDAILTANTGVGSITPSQITFTDGTWSGNVTFRGAGGSVTLTCSDYSSPPHTGTSNQFTVSPGALYGLQVLLPGETAQGGTADGKTGTPTSQTAGTPFTLTLRAVDQWWNLVPTASVDVALASSDSFAWMPADTTIANGQLLLSVRLHKAGPQRIWVSQAGSGSLKPDTSSVVNIIGGTFSRVLILAPGQSPAPGTSTGQSGPAIDQSINYAFTVTVLATDQWWNPVTGPTDVVHLTSSDPIAQLPADQAMVNGRVDMSVRLGTGGYQMITVSDITNSSKLGGSTQVRMITSGFHLEANVGSSTARAGEPFTLTVKVTNDAGGVIQEVNSFVTITVKNANTRQPGKGLLLTTQFQLLQGQRSISETYTFAEPIILEATDDAGNQPAVTAPITITPGQPAQIVFTTDPTWVHGNKHATLIAQLVDAYDNGVPDQQIQFEIRSGLGTLTPTDSMTDATGVQHADYLSPREPQTSRIRASWQELFTEYDLVTAFVDPAAPGGYVTNYPNPFHPNEGPTTIAYKLDDAATVTLRIFTQSGDLVQRAGFPSGSSGGQQGLNTWLWDGKNGAGKYVSSGSYLVLIEAQGQGETLHVIKRLVAVVR